MAQDRNMSDNCEFFSEIYRTKYASASVADFEHSAVHAQAIWTYTFSLKGTTSTTGARK